MTPLLSKSQTTDGDEKAIIGKWLMIKMEIKDGLYFDVSDKDSSYKRFIKLILAGNPGFSNDKEHNSLSKEDSLSYKNDFEKAFEEFKQLFVEFKNDHVYVTNQSGAEGVSTLITGTFSMDTKSRILKRFEHDRQITDESHYELTGHLLILRPKEIENSSSIVFKRAW